MICSREFAKLGRSERIRECIYSSDASDSSIGMISRLSGGLYVRFGIIEA